MIKFPIVILDVSNSELRFAYPEFKDMTDEEINDKIIMNSNDKRYSIENYNMLKQEKIAKLEIIPKEWVTQFCITDFNLNEASVEDLLHLMECYVFAPDPDTAKAYKMLLQQFANKGVNLEDVRRIIDKSGNYELKQKADEFRSPYDRLFLNIKGRLSEMKSKQDMSHSERMFAEDIATFDPFMVMDVAMSRMNRLKDGGLELSVEKAEEYKIAAKVFAKAEKYAIEQEERIND